MLVTEKLKILLDKLSIICHFLNESYKIDAVPLVFKFNSPHLFFVL